MTVLYCLSNAPRVTLRNILYTGLCIQSFQVPRLVDPFHQLLCLESSGYVGQFLLCRWGIPPQQGQFVYRQHSSAMVVDIPGVLTGVNYLFDVVLGQIRHYLSFRSPRRQAAFVKQR